MANKKKKKNSNYQTPKKAGASTGAKKGLSKQTIIAIICAVVILAAVAVTITFCALNGNDDAPAAPDYCAHFESRNVEGHEIKYVKMDVENHGTIVLMLDATTAPVTVANFINLANEGFYDGLTFHRIIENFMIQGGDPKADGTGGNTDEDGNEINIKGEFANNGHANDISHLRGVISMAREGNPYYPALSYGTASSQFFICNADSLHLDGDYASFGYVIAGLDVVDSITEEGIKYTSDGVIKDKTNQPKITAIDEITKEEAMSYVK